MQDKDFICKDSCGACCDILEHIKEYGNIYPTNNTCYNDFLEEFFSPYDRLNIKPLFNWRIDFIKYNYKCPYKGKESCIIPRELRNRYCLEYKCKIYNAI